MPVAVYKKVEISPGFQSALRVGFRLLCLGHRYVRWPSARSTTATTEQLIKEGAVMLTASVPATTRLFLCYFQCPLEVR